MSNELTIKEAINSLKLIVLFLWTKKWIVIISTFLFISLGIFFSLTRSYTYTAKLTFALEDNAGGSGNLMSAMGLANTLGIDLGTNAGGAFEGANLIELIKSRFVVEKALLDTISINGKVYTLADYFIKFNEINTSNIFGLGKSEDIFPFSQERYFFTRVQDSLLGRISEHFTNPKGVFTVGQQDKKVSIIIVKVKSKDELFAKKFSESILKEVSNFYVNTKSAKAKANVEILQKQADSVKNELNKSLTGVALANDNTFNLNSAMLLPKIIGTKRQIDVQANTAILTQLLANLEMAKVTLRKETPLIQIIDRPILPLQREKIGKIKAGIVFGIAGAIFTIFLLLLQNWKNKYL